MSYSAGQESEEIEFLKDQVHRLNVSLSQYQKNNPRLPPTATDETLETSDLKVMNKRLLSPLIAEYDLIIEEQNQQILLYQAELESMTGRVEQVTQENNRLHSELRKSLEARMETATQSAGSKFSSVGGMMDTLQQQLEMLTRDRDNYRELLKKTSNELEILQKIDQDKTRKLLSSKTELVSAQQAALLAKKTAEELELSCSNLEEERIRCLKAIKAQETELSTLQDNLSEVKTELRTATLKNDEFKKSLDEMTFQLRRRESERAKALDAENSLDDRLHILQITNTDLEGKLLATQREMANLSREKAELEETLTSVQARVVSLEQREHEAVCHVKESMQIAESALLEKEQASIKEQQLAKEVERLKVAMSTILKEAGERTRKEVDILREECNKSIDKMGVEIHRLEQECGERQAQLERCQREKKMVEKELEKAQAQKPLELVQTGDSLHELQKRVCLAERARDDALVKLEAVTAKAKRLESNVQEEKQANLQLAEEHRKWQKQVQGESQELRERKIKALGEVDSLKQRLRLSEQAKEAAEVKLVQELGTLERRQEMREKEIVYRLESSEDTHRKSIQELRNLLTAQHRVGTKWREESKTMAQKFEKTISDLKTELMRYKGRSSELTKQLTQLKHAKEELTKRLKEATYSNSSLQQRMKEAEAQSETAMEQVSKLTAREKQLLHERRELNRQLDKFKLHLKNSETMLPASSHYPHSKLASHHSSEFHPHSFLPMAPTTSSLSQHPPPPAPPPHPHDNAQWNRTLSQLRHSIQQVREDLGLQRRGTEALAQEEEDDISEHSVLSRRDLSHSTTHSVS